MSPGGSFLRGFTWGSTRYPTPGEVNLVIRFIWSTLFIYLFIFSINARTAEKKMNYEPP